MTKKEFYQQFVINSAEWIVSQDFDAYVEKEKRMPIDNVLEYADDAWEQINVLCDEEENYDGQIIPAY